MRTNADKKATRLENRNTIDKLKCVDPKRRKRLEKRGNEKDWLKWYLAETYPRPFERPHEAMIEGIIEADENNSRFAEALERGIGKSVVGWGMVLYLKFTGKRKFPACVPWADKALKRAFGFWKNAVCYNERLLADYPEYCQPFAHARGIAQRVPNVSYRGEGKPTGAKLAVGDGIIVFPSGLGCIGGATINGNIRGLNHPQEDGKVLRPDFIFIDDVQDRGTAKSPILVADTVSIIDGDVAGCGDAGKDLAMVMACNCIVPDDVPAHYLKNSEWKALRVPCIESWPDGWNEQNSPSKLAWEEWADLWRSGGDDLAFYRANRVTMTSGMKLSAPAAFKGSDKCPDAFYGVIRMYFRMGHESFMAERQQSPVEKLISLDTLILTTAHIRARAVAGRKPFTVPEWVTRVVASTDLNPSYAFSTVLVGFGEDQSAAVVWYGIYPTNISIKNMNAPTFGRELYESLCRHGKELAACQVPPERWAIDCGGDQFDHVVRFAGMSSSACGIVAHAFSGIGGARYNSKGATARKGDIHEECHGCMDSKNGRHRRWVAWNTNYWKSVMQRAWVGEIGVQGSASLFEGKHDEYALQLCSEHPTGAKLTNRNGQTYDIYADNKGKNNFLDSTTQAYALAAYLGIGTGGRTRKDRAPLRAVIGGKPIEKETKTGEDNGEKTNQQGESAGKRRAVIGRRSRW